MAFVINQVAVSGNLCADPELRATAGGTAVLELRLAVNERVKRGEKWEDDPSYLTVVVFGGVAEYLAKTLAKGQAVCVAGRLHESRWKAKDGSGRSRVEVRANDVVPMGTRAKAHAQGGVSRQQGDEQPMTPAEAAEYMGAKIVEEPRAAAPDMYAEDIPF